jgi:hypothetical protein
MLFLVVVAMICFDNFQSEHFDANDNTNSNNTNNNDQNNDNTNNNDKNDTKVSDDNKTNKKPNELDVKLSDNTKNPMADIYENAKTFENDEDRQGLDKCLEDCTGNCVEFGLLGKAFCFEK